MGGGYLLRHPEPPGVSPRNAHRYELSYKHYASRAIAAAA